MRSLRGFWKAITISALIVLSVLLFRYGFRPLTFDLQVDRAEKLIRSGKIEEGLLVYQTLVEKNSKNPKAPSIFLRMGELYQYSLNRPDQAIAIYDRMNLRYPSTPWSFEAYKRKGEYYFSLQRHEQAVKAYQGIVSNFSSLEDIDYYRLRLGIELIQLKQFEAARKEFKAILEGNLKDPFIDQVLFYTGNSYWMEGKQKQAIPVYESILQNFPSSSFLVEAQFNLADCYESLGDFEKGLKIYQEIQAVYPNRQVIDRKIEKNIENRSKLGRVKKGSPVAAGSFTSETAPVFIPKSRPPRKVIRRNREYEKIIQEILREYH